MLDGVRGPLSVSVKAGASTLVQPGPGTFDLFLSLPTQSNLMVGIPAAVPNEDFSIELRTDTEQLLLEGTRNGEEWRACVETFDEQPVQIRFIDPNA